MKSIQERFDEKWIPDPETGCWLWIGWLDRKGYGQITIGGRNFRSHRIAYELYHGGISDGLELDHLCRHQECVNPNHLEPVTHLENVRRGKAGQVAKQTQEKKRYCTRGHPYSGKNLVYTRNKPTKSGFQRSCRACNRIRTRMHRQTLRYIV